MAEDQRSKTEEEEVAAQQPFGIALLESKKVCLDHSGCLGCQGGSGAPVACKDVVQKVVFGSTLLKVSFYRKRNKRSQRKPKERTRLTWLGENKIGRQADNSDLPLGSHLNERLL